MKQASRFEKTMSVILIAAILLQTAPLTLLASDPYEEIMYGKMGDQKNYQYIQVDNPHIINLSDPIGTQNHTYYLFPNPAGPDPCNQVGDKKTKLYIQLDFDEKYIYNLGTALSPSASDNKLVVEVDANMQGYNSNQNNISSELVKLKLELDNSKNVFRTKDIYVIDISDDISVNDLSSYQITLTGNVTAVDYPQNQTPAFRLSLYTNTERVLSVVDRNSIYTIPVTPVTDIANPTPYEMDYHRVKFEWNNTNSICTNPEFENYQIQILKLENSLSDYVLDDTKSRAVLDWENALTIETGNTNTISVALKEGRGFYAWRVRPIGNEYPGGIADYRNLGKWSSVTQLEDPSNSRYTKLLDKTNLIEGPVFYYDGMEEDLNWSYKRVFVEAEEGNGMKFLETSQYADYLLNNRQTQTYQSSSDQTVVAQTLYDHVGRAGLQSLPVPYTDDKISVPAIGGLNYRVNVMSGATGTYDKSKWDDDNTINSPLPINSPSGQLSYYTSTPTDPNHSTLPLPTTGKSTTPNDIYPYTRTVFTTDGTGRIREQGGVGGNYKIGSGHTVKTYYGTPSDKELLVVFGEEAPTNTQVLKTTVIDPNGVSTVSYNDSEGKVLASGVSIPDTPTLPINDANPELNEEKYQPQSLTEELNEDIFISGSIISQKKIHLASQTQITFDYNYDRDFYDYNDEKCEALNQEACDYEIEFIAINAETKQKEPLGAGAVFQISNATTPDPVSINYTTPPIGPGEFILQRKLTPINSNVIPDPGSTTSPPETITVTQQEYIDSDIRTNLKTLFDTELGPVITQIGEIKTDPYTVEQFYTYLDTDPDWIFYDDPESPYYEYLMKNGTNDCGLFTLPKLECIECENDDIDITDFETYLLSKWGGANALIPGQTFSEVSDFFYDYLGNKMFEGTLNFSYGNPTSSTETYTNGDGLFEKILLNMIDEYENNNGFTWLNGQAVDKCYLWNIWKPMVDNLDKQLVYLDDGVKKINKEYRLLDQFLENGNLRCFDSFSREKETNEELGNTSYIEYAYHVMPYLEYAPLVEESFLQTVPNTDPPRQSPINETTRQLLGEVSDGNGGFTIEVIETEPFGPGYRDCEQDHSYWSEFYSALIHTRKNNLPNGKDRDPFNAKDILDISTLEELHSKTILIKNRIEKECDTQCESRRGEFDYAIKRLFRDNTIFIEGEDRIYNRETGFFIDYDDQVHLPKITQDEIDCLVDALVLNCQDEYCDLTYQTITDNGTEYYKSFGTEAEIAKYQKVWSNTFQLGIAKGVLFDIESGTMTAPDNVAMPNNKVMSIEEFPESQQNLFVDWMQDILTDYIEADGTTTSDIINYYKTTYFPDVDNFYYNNASDKTDIGSAEQIYKNCMLTQYAYAAAANYFYEGLGHNYLITGASIHQDGNDELILVDPCWDCCGILETVCPENDIDCDPPDGVIDVTVTKYISYGFDCWNDVSNRSLHKWYADLRSDEGEIVMNLLIPPGWASIPQCECEGYICDNNLSCTDIFENYTRYVPCPGVGINDPSISPVYMTQDYAVNEDFVTSGDYTYQEMPLQECGNTLTQTEIEREYPNYINWTNNFFFKTYDGDNTTTGWNDDKYNFILKGSELFLKRDEYKNGGIKSTDELFLCDISFQTTGTACDFTLKFEFQDIEFPEEHAVDVKQIDCEIDIAEELEATLRTQMNDYIDNRANQAVSEYKLACVENQSIDHKTSISYQLGYYHYTLYYYDRAGNLIKTVAPKGVDIDETRSSRNAPNAVTNHEFVTYYDYNSLGQMTSKKSPDEDLPSGFAYNLLGQLRFSQDARQKPHDRYSYTNYDELGRVVEAGEFSKGTASFAPLFGLHPSNPNIVTAPPPTETILNATGLPAGVEKTMYVKTFYNEQATLPAPYSHLEQRFLNNRVSYSVRDMDGQDDPLVPTPDPTKDLDKTYTYYSYDPHGNVEWVIQQIPTMTMDLNAPYNFIVSKIDYTYDLVSGNVRQVTYNNQRTDEFHQRYHYDENNRIKKVTSSRDSVIWDLDAQYYYYPHGPLRRVELGEDNIQGLDYTYTAQGWLKAINHSELNELGNDPGRDGEDFGQENIFPQDVFGMMLTYNDEDFFSVSPTGQQFNNGTGRLFDQAVTDNNTKSLYNGNIASYESGYNPLNSTFINTHVNPYFGNYEISSDHGLYTTAGASYEYDELNRILGSSFYFYGDRANLIPKDIWRKNIDDQFDTDYKYDPNGNIMNLNRNRISNGFAGINMDMLSYSYTPGTNRLDHIDDAQTLPQSYTLDITDQATGNYDYDESGNLIQDLNENITSIIWTPDGKVKKVEKSNPNQTIEFVYDSKGDRVVKKVSDPNSIEPTSYTYYVRDASGQVMAIYKESGVMAATATVCYTVEKNCTIYEPTALPEAEVCTQCVNTDGIPSPNNDCYDVTFLLDEDNCKVYAWVLIPLLSAEPIKLTYDLPSPCTNLSSVDLTQPIIYTKHFNCDNPPPLENCWAECDFTITGSGTSPQLGGKTSMEHYVYGSGAHGRVATLRAKDKSYSPHIIEESPSHLGEYYARYVNEKEYEIKDHLGNVRAVVSDMKKISNLDSENNVDDNVDQLAMVKAINSYYPFGMTMHGLTWPDPAPGESAGYQSGNTDLDMPRYGFNGMERDAELKGESNSYDFGARMYDPRVGRFLSLDPKSINFPFHSPYIYAGNSPLILIDEEGEAPKCYMLVKHYAKSTIKREKAAYTFYEIQNVEKFTTVSQSIAYLMNEDVSTLYTSEGYFMNVTGIDQILEIVKDPDPVDYVASQATMIYRRKGGYEENFDGPGEYVVKNWEKDTDGVEKVTAKNWYKYQGQINGINGMVEYKFNNVDYDGYKGGTLLEAKGRYNWVLHPDNPNSDPNRTYGDFFDQLERQVKGADGMDIEWHFLEKSTMDGFKNFLDKQGYDVPDNVTFKHTPKENK